MTVEEKRKRYDTAIALATEAYKWLNMFFSKEDKEGNLIKAGAFLIAANCAMGAEQEQTMLVMFEGLPRFEFSAEEDLVDNVITVDFKP